MPLLIAHHDPRDLKTAQFGSIQGLDKDFQLGKGVPRAGSWSDEAHYVMDEDLGERLEDFMVCHDRVLLVSERVRDFLAAQDLPAVEIHPVRLHNREDVPLDQPAFVVHCVDRPDALDATASGAKKNMIDPTRILSIQRLVLDPAKVSDRPLWRMTGLANPCFFSQGLADAIIAEGFTGIRFDGIDSYSKDGLL